MEASLTKKKPSKKSTQICCIKKTFQQGNGSSRGESMMGNRPHRFRVTKKPGLRFALFDAFNQKGGMWAFSIFAWNHFWMSKISRLKRSRSEKIVDFRHMVKRAGVKNPDQMIHVSHGKTFLLFIQGPCYGLLCGIANCLELKWPLFWLEKTFFWGVDLKK